MADRRPGDANPRAFQITLETTGQEPKFDPLTKPVKAAKPGDPIKMHAAVELGRLGGLKGGAAKATALSRAKRSQTAAKAAKTPWAKK
jgi:hypothetical protein